MIMTNQEAFDINWNHFVVGKGERSCIADGGGCAYRGECGTKCGIGLLIPDDKYSPRFEGVSVSGGSFAYVFQQHELLQVLNELGFGGDQMGFLTELQRCHDGASGRDFHKKIELSLRNLAVSFDLAIPSVLKGTNT